MRDGDTQLGYIIEKLEAIRLLIEQQERRVGVELDLVGFGWNECERRVEIHVHARHAISDFLRVFPDAERSHHDMKSDRYECAFHGAKVFTLAPLDEPTDSMASAAVEG